MRNDDRKNVGHILLLLPFQNATLTTVYEISIYLVLRVKYIWVVNDSEGTLNSFIRIILFDIV